MPVAGHITLLTLIGRIKYVNHLLGLGFSVRKLTSIKIVV